MFHELMPWLDQLARLRRTRRWRQTRLLLGPRLGRLLEKLSHPGRAPVDRLVRAFGLDPRRADGAELAVVGTAVHAFAEWVVGLLTAGDEPRATYERFQRLHAYFAEDYPLAVERAPDLLGSLIDRLHHPDPIQAIGNRVARESASRLGEAEPTGRLRECVAEWTGWFVDLAREADRVRRQDLALAALG
jgi:hypothetical protein